MRPITSALLASLVAASLLAGCAANDAGESSEDGLTTDIEVTCPEANSTMDSNNTTMTETTCPEEESTTETPDNTSVNNSTTSG